MSEETRKVLEMLKEGKITTEDADRLLERLAAGAPGEAAGPQEKPLGEGKSAGKKPRYLRIMVDRPGEKAINIRMPLSFVRNSQQLLSFLPQGVAERLKERGILFGISGIHGLINEDFAQNLEELNVDVDQEGGKRVKIFCE